MSNPNISTAEMRTLLEMVINSPIGSYVNAMQKHPLVNKFVEAHNQVVSGGRLDVLNAAEASAVDTVRALAAKAMSAAQAAARTPPAGKADLRGGKVVPPQSC